MYKITNYSVHHLCLWVGYFVRMSKIPSNKRFSSTNIARLQIQMPLHNADLCFLLQTLSLYWSKQTWAQETAGQWCDEAMKSFIQKADVLYKSLHVNAEVGQKQCRYELLPSAMFPGVRTKHCETRQKKQQLKIYLSSARTCFSLPSSSVKELL